MNMNKILKRIIILIILMTATFGIYTYVQAEEITTPLNVCAICPSCGRNFYVENAYGNVTCACGNTFDLAGHSTQTIKQFGSTMANMPARNTAGLTGLNPQYYINSAGRKVTLPESRYSLDTDSWQAAITGEVEYCSLRHAYVRYGTFDPDTYFIYPTNNVIAGKDIGGFADERTVKQEVEEYIQKYIKDSNSIHAYSNQIALETYRTVRNVQVDTNVYYNNINENAIGRGYISTINGPSDAVQKVRIETEISNQLSKILNHIFNVMDPSKKTTDWENTVDGDRTSETISGLHGPEVVALETDSTNHTAGYREEGTGTFKNLDSTGSDKRTAEANTIKAYLLTALENAYKYETNNCALEYTLNDIQTAYWWALYEYDHNSDSARLPRASSTAKGYELYLKAKEYAVFVQELATNSEYKASIDDSSAKVIANTNTQEYIIGPYSVNYPYHEDISYLKALTLKTENGIVLTYGEDYSDFEIILNSGVQGSNGTTKKYPNSGEKFFVKVKANKINYSSKVKLGVKFEYLNSSEINYKMINSDANIYRYEGHISFDEGENKISTGIVTIHITVTYDYTKEQKIFETRYGHQGDCPHKVSPDTSGHCDYCSKYSWQKEIGKEYIDDSDSYRPSSITLYYAQPYIKMTESPVVTHLAQKLLITSNGERMYLTKDVETTEFKDLSMNLGGLVWEDTKGGKEDVVNGTIDTTEKKVPNVTVNLYKNDGTLISTTKTNDKGEYRFNNLNAMYKYYVQFVYNGQYYQPTTYTSPADATNGWGRGNWQTNSNATDIKTERQSYNEKFASIGSSPNCYGQNKRTFTKQELLGYTLKSNGEYEKTRDAVIDEFGNVILETSSDETTKQMIEYAKDCRINAYTGNGSGSFDSYPTPNIFVIDNGISYEFRILDSNYGTSGMRTADIGLLYPSAYYINLGLNPREESDLAVKKDISKVTLEINGQTHEYTYNTLEDKENADQQWEINVRLSDAYYDANYSRELYKSDYLYKASNYGENHEAYGKTEAGELETYVTYKIMVRNQALSIKTRVDEIVDYYDQDYDYIDNRSYIEIKRGSNEGKYRVNAETTSKYGQNTETTLTGYDKLYIRGVGSNTQKVDDAGENVGEPISDGIYLEGGQTAYVYLTFKVKKDVRDGEKWLKLDEDILTGNVADFGVGKENIVEVNGYSTIYADGTKVPNVGDVSGKPAGIIDHDSTPGNLNPSDVPKDGTINFNNFEDDTDKSPNIRIRLYRDDEANRVIAGSVWEDERTEELQAATTIGDGIRKEGETLINGVKVQLVELMDNGTEFVWREFENGSGTASKTSPIINAIINETNLISDYQFADSHDGTYAFKSFVPGKYVVRFTYGDSERTVLTKDVNTAVNKTLEKVGLNTKSYNGQDFKSTTYQEGIEQNKEYAWREASIWKEGQETLGKLLTTVTTFKQDASNNETANAVANQLKAYLYDITASDKITNVSDAKDIESRRNKVIDYSDNDVINHIAEVLASYRELPEYLGTSYNKTQLQSLLDELMAQTQMTAETGLIVVEFEYDKDESGNQVVDNKSSYKIQNVDLGLEERPKAQLVVNKEVTNVKLTLADGSILFDAKSTASNVLWRDHKAYEVGYNGNFMDPNKFGNILNIRNKNLTKFGLIQVSMDEELMHGATIQISYNVTVSNIGEVDYKDNSFYYKGNVSDVSKVVTTKANQVIDYVANNLQFYAKDNSNWSVISKDDLLSQGLVNTALSTQLDKYNTIIVTDKLSNNLVPNKYKDKVNGSTVDSVTVPLVLTQLITSENETDDLTYRNIVEIAKTSNTVGRKNEYSVVGNQDPTLDPQELDSDKAEIVRVLPPFGNAGFYIIVAIITLAAVGIVVCGVIFIKKKVLKNKE